MSEIRRSDVETAVRQVTFFEDRAEVVRAGRAEVAAGVSFLSVGGVAAMVDDPTVVARLTRGAERARIVAAKVQRQVREVQGLGTQELAAALADQRRALLRREEAERTLQRAQGRAARAFALLQGCLAAVQKVPRGDPAGWRAAYARLDQELSQALDEVARGTREQRAAREDEARADLRLAQGRALHPRFETQVIVQVEAREAGEVEVELTYRTPCALWRPEHVARLRRRPDGSGHDLHITTLATVWQRTGERWHDVACRFSTARPGKPATPPLITDDILVSRKKTEAERRQVVVEARDQAIALAGLGRRAPVGADELPGVEDGGEPLHLPGRRPATIESDGQPVRVEVAEAVLPAQVELVCFPERSAAAHLRATATNSGPVPLLAGPVRLFREGEMVGSGRLGFVARGEPFELGFGPDDGLRVRRTLESQREVTPLIGTQKVSLAVRLFVSNLSGSGRRLLVTERVPRSEIEDVKIVVEKSQGGRLDDRDGFVRFELEVPPHGTRELELSYRVEAGARVQLPF